MLVAYLKSPFICIVIAFGLFINFPLYAAPCGLYGAEYVPQNTELKKSFDKNTDLVNRSLSFVMRVEKGDMSGPTRNLFLNFDAYNFTGEKVSTMRLGNTHSNGIPRESFSTYFGMFCTFGKDSESDCKEMKQSANFYPIGINKNLQQTSLHDAPEIIILPDTYGELTRNSYQYPEDWDQYIKFYTADRIYPDFRFYDFWERKKCGEGDK